MRCGDEASGATGASRLRLSAGGPDQRPLHGTRSSRSGREHGAVHFRVEEEVLLSALAAHAESVIVPSAASAAKPIVSERVGWGWIVRPMSSASALNSRACTVSAISSPALTSTFPAPSTLVCVHERRQLVDGGHLTVHAS
jgi:hypothetical protein